MPRRAGAPARSWTPDPVYNSVLVARITNKIMQGGEKAVARRVMYNAMDIIKEKTGKDPVEVLDNAVKNVMPVLEVRPRRVGGATYQVPVEVRSERRLSLAIRWILGSVREKKGRATSKKLADELVDAFNREGAAMTKRDNVHRMADANKAFAHFAW